MTNAKDINMTKFYSIYMDGWLEITQEDIDCAGDDNRAFFEKRLADAMAEKP